LNAPSAIAAIKYESALPKITRGVPLAWIVAALLGYIAVDNVLVYAFLGYRLPLVVLAGGVTGLCIAALVLASGRTLSAETKVSGSSLCVSLLLSLCLLILGGEGRFLYANADWQIRDAVLADMAKNGWPFVTSIGGVDHVLRAPLGMYLKPALLSGYSQSLRDVAMLVCNAFMLTGILALGSVLLTTMRARVIAFAVFFMFSGLDIIGTIAVNTIGSGASFDHLELWIQNSQFSSHLTMLFWVPQHAFAGWICAVLFLLWHKKLLPIGPFAAAIPLCAIWSPLAIMGVVPFAVFAGIRTILDRKVRTSDVALAIVATLIALGPLIYLTTGSTAVASRLSDLTMIEYGAVILLEVAPIAALVIWQRHRAGLGTIVPVVATLSLVLMPLYCLGDAIDFQMRASIVPLAILAFGIANLFADPNKVAVQTRKIVLFLLTLGAFTPLMELRRALLLAPSPEPQCSLIDAWHAQSGNIVTYGSYFARIDAFPSWIRPLNPNRIDTAHPKKCWERDWETPRF
jgi:hypothetical protein